MYKYGAYLAVVIAFACSKVSEQNTRFVVGRDGEGTVTDTLTGLVWSATDNNENIYPGGAWAFCQDNGMRLPTRRELKTLYQAGQVSDPAGCNSSGASLWQPEGISLSCNWYFSQDAEGCGAFDFSTGEQRGCLLVNRGRALCVSQEFSKADGPVVLPKYDGLSIPVSKNGTTLSPMLVVSVSSASVMLHGAAVAEVADLRKQLENPTPGTNPYLIPKLKESLEAYRDKTTITQGSFDRRVLLQADRGIYFDILWMVIYSMAAAGFDEPSFAVISQQSGEAQLLKTTPYVHRSGNDLKIEIKVVYDSIILSLGPLEKVQLTENRYEKLLEHLKGVKEANPFKADVILDFEGNGTYQQIIEAIDVCIEAGFPQVNVVPEIDVAYDPANGMFPAYQPTGSLGPANPPKAAPSGVDVVDGRAEVKGSLDKEIIRRVIRRAINQIKFCYEQGLQTNPNLEGKVKIFFVISPNGSVASASPVAGISNDVDKCVARKISQLSFPAPQGGGIVEVTYPFTFQAVPSN